MGIGGGIFLISFGAIFAFAVHADIPWLDLHVVGWVMMFAGVSVLVLTLYFWQQRKVRNRLTLVEQTRMIHEPDAPVIPDPPDGDLPPRP
jgi:hypothetical protein